MNIQLDDLFHVAEDAVICILECDDECFHRAVGEIQALIKLLFNVEPEDDKTLGLKKVLNILDRTGLFVVNPDTRVTAAIVLPYLRKVRASLKENGNADNN